MATTAVTPRRGREKRPSALSSADLSSRILWISSVAIAVFLAVSLLSFNVADPPSHVVAHYNDPVANWCGPIGAAIAYWSYHTIGIGIWVILLGIGSWVTIVFQGKKITPVSYTHLTLPTKA